MPPLQQQKTLQQHPQQHQAAGLAGKRTCSDAWDSSDSDFEDAPAGGASGSSKRAAVKSQSKPLRAPKVRPQQQQQQQQQQAAGKGGGKAKLAAAAAAGKKRQHLQAAAPAAKRNQPGGASKRVPAGAATAQHPAPRPRWQQPSLEDDSSDDVFVAGSLRRAPRAAPQLPKAVAPAAKPAAAAETSRGTGPRPAAGTAAGAAAAAASGSVFGSRVEVIRLDVLDFSRWPGWQASVAGIRQVAPYRPAQPAAAEAAAAAGEASADATPHSRVLLTADILSFDLSRCGSGFQGVLIDAAGAAPPSALAAAAPADSGGGSSNNNDRLPHQLSSLNLSSHLMSWGLLFLWAAKAQTAQAVRWMAARGFRYVENLTWQQLGPNNKPLMDASPLFLRSHLTLLMGRRGQESKGHLELRHQRTPDVIISTALPPGRCPEAVYSMIETLLPESAAYKAAQGGGGSSSGGQLRLLELSFNGSDGGRERCGRPGWVRLVQTSI